MGSRGVDRFSVFDNTTDVVQRLLGQTRVLVAREQVSTVLGQGHVAVHAGTVVAKHGFWHEGRGFTETVRNIVHNVFVDLNLIRFLVMVLKRVAISFWPAVATSWWCASTTGPISSMIRHMVERMSCEESTGGTGK